MDGSSGGGGALDNRPEIWIFLIIVLAVLLGVVICTSFIMHLIQRRQRRQLQLRIINGEVDLEALGIKRLNVPQEAIEKMPQYTFKSVAENSSNTSIPQVGETTVAHDFFQPTCSICLDDFVYEQTQVRELPCRHIFHPECIDPFLRENSSLCPLCKRSALPTGFCPITVTNVMVRRERLSRQMGGRPTRSSRYPIYQAPREATAWTRRLDRIRGPSAVSAPERARTRDRGQLHGVAEEIPEPTPVEHEGDTELGPVRTQDSAPDDEQPPPEIARRGTTARRAWRRERLASLHAREQREREEQIQQEEQRRPLWRRVLHIN